MEDGIPKQIGRYTIDRLLGSGAMGFVFLGRDPELDRAVAVKTVRDLHMDPETLKLFLERFRNEARAAARLHHPNIVQVYDVGDDADLGPYLVFEYVAGSTLKQILRSRGALDALGVVRLAEEIGDALSLAHEHGIIHRDLKPDNLLVTPDGMTKLADFGIARIPNAALTREGQFLGTPCYAAPETLKLGEYGVRSDLFSFAAVLYEACAGARAFPGDDAVCSRPQGHPRRAPSAHSSGRGSLTRSTTGGAGDHAGALQNYCRATGLLRRARRASSRRLPQRGVRRHRRDRSPCEPAHSPAGRQHYRSPTDAKRRLDLSRAAAGSAPSRRRVDFRIP